MPSVSDENLLVPVDSLAAQTTSSIEAQLAALELEQKQLQLEIMRDQVAAIKSKKAAIAEQNRIKIMSTQQFLAQRKATQEHCNHRKGGANAQAVIQGEGDSDKYAVVKHKLPNNRWWVICQRCLKEWHPANPWNIEGGELQPLPATPGWEEAIRFNTDNTPSESSIFQFEKTIEASA